MTTQKPFLIILITFLLPGLLSDLFGQVKVDTVYWNKPIAIFSSFDGIGTSCDSCFMISWNDKEINIGDHPLVAYRDSNLVWHIYNQQEAFKQLYNAYLAMMKRQEFLTDRHVKLLDSINYLNRKMTINHKKQHKKVRPRYSLIN